MKKIQLGMAFWKLGAEALLFLLLVTGVTYAWFAQTNRLTTLVSVVPPGNITIAGPNGSEMLLLDLDFNSESHLPTEGNTPLTVRRPICIKSTEAAHRLEIAYTTNMEGLTVKLFPATQSPSSGTVPGRDTAEGKTYWYTYDNSSEKAVLLNQGTPLSGNPGLQNYDGGDTKDENAVAQYWQSPVCFDHNPQGYGTVSVDDGNAKEVTTVYHETQEYNPVTDLYENYFYTYYVIEVSWTEKSKETDLLYILAQTAAWRS